MNCDKHIHDLKNPKTISQIKINPRPKIYLNSNMFFFTKFKDKKTYDINSHRQIESVDINTDHFCGLDQHQWCFYLYTTEILTTFVFPLFSTMN